MGRAEQNGPKGAHMGHRRPPTGLPRPQVFHWHVICPRNSLAATEHAPPAVLGLVLLTLGCWWRVQVNCAALNWPQWGGSGRSLGGCVPTGGEHLGAMYQGAYMPSGAGTWECVVQQTVYTSVPPLPSPTGSIQSRPTQPPCPPLNPPHAERRVSDMLGGMRSALSLAC